MSEFPSESFNLPLSPQESSFSLFYSLQKRYGTNLPVARLNRYKLNQIYQVIEEILQLEQLPFVVYAGTQTVDLATGKVPFSLQSGNLLQKGLFFEQVTTRLAIPSEYKPVDLDKSDPLLGEWFLAVLARRFSILICGYNSSYQSDIAGSAGDTFETLITFEPQVIWWTLHLLEPKIHQQHGNRLKAELEVYPPVLPELRYVSQILLQLSHISPDSGELLPEQLLQKEASEQLSHLLHEASQPVTTLVSLLELSEKANQVLPQDISVMLKAANDLKNYLTVLRKVNNIRSGQH